MTTEVEQKTKVEVTEAAERLRVSLNERLAEQSAKGVAPWQTPLDPSKGERLPYNPLSKNAQATPGFNGLVLASIARQSGFTDPRWVTKAQMEARGWGPVKGQHPASVEYYRDSYKKAIRDPQGNPVFGKDGKAVTEEIKLTEPQVYAVNMYNMEQIQELKYAKEKIPPLLTTERNLDLEGLQKLARESGAKIELDGGNYYQKTSDGVGVIHIPRETGMAQHQAVLRGIAEKAVLLDGPAGARRDDTPEMRHVKQQLRVDLATRAMSEKLGVPVNPDKTAAYKQHYADIIARDPDQIRYACKDASKAVERMTTGDFVPAKKQEQQHEQSQQAERKEPEQQKQQQPVKAKAKGKALEI
jgi:antirestriction protein ArdC